MEEVAGLLPGRLVLRDESVGAVIRNILARLRLIARRNGVPAPGNGPVQLTECGLMVAGREFRLSPAEYRVAQLLWKAGGGLVAHERLERALYGRTGEFERQAVRQVVYRLRTRLGELGRVVETVPGFGYRLKCDETVKVSLWAGDRPAGKINGEKRRRFRAAEPTQVEGG